jgi:uncharacterized protein (DUF2252 family)
MATSKTKTGATLVSTIGGRVKYRFTSILMKQVQSRYAYFATKNEIFSLINSLFRTEVAEFPTIVYTGTQGRTTYNARKNSYGGFSIGCQDFDRNTVRAIAASVGHSKSFINAYLPRLAKAAAAGR